jgi:hypothetical protein
MHVGFKQLSTMIVCWSRTGTIGTPTQKMKECVNLQLGFEGPWTCRWMTLLFKLLTGFVLLVWYLFSLGWGFLVFIVGGGYWFFAQI